MTQPVIEIRCDWCHRYMLIVESDRQSTTTCECGGDYRFVQRLKPEADQWPCRQTVTPVCHDEPNQPNERCNNMNLSIGSRLDVVDWPQFLVVDRDGDIVDGPYDQHMAAQDEADARNADRYNNEFFPYRVATLSVELDELVPSVYTQLQGRIQVRLDSPLGEAVLEELRRAAWDVDD